MDESIYTINPLTNKVIKKGGKIYMKLVKDKHIIPEQEDERVLFDHTDLSKEETDLKIKTFNANNTELTASRGIGMFRGKVVKVKKDPSIGRPLGSKNKKGTLKDRMKKELLENDEEQVLVKKSDPIDIPKKQLKSSKKFKQIEVESFSESESEQSDKNENKQFGLKSEYYSDVEIANSDEDYW